MLRDLSIKNYAIIDKLNIEFEQGLNIITGETGAGKSILLGALGLIAGSRADSSVIGNTADTCVAEATFNIDGYQLENFFTNYDLDYCSTIKVRRIISRNGRSRAYIDDFPVNITMLRELCSRLIDIHSQHQTLLLGESTFQTNIVDAVADNSKIRKEYSRIYHELIVSQKEINRLKTNATEASKRKDYIKFQLEQILALELKSGEQLSLEAERDQLLHANDIINALAQCYSAIEGDGEYGSISALRGAMNGLSRVADVHVVSKELHDRLESVYLELRDIASESESLAENIEADPKRLEFIEERLDAINSLCFKHGVDNSDELLQLQSEFESELENIDNVDSSIDELEAALRRLKTEALELAGKIYESRKKAAPVIEKHVVRSLTELGIKDSTFEVNITHSDKLSDLGADHIELLFSANKGQKTEPIGMVASGGEMARLMLSIKSLVSEKIKLPTIIFDEIDTGVSGAIADKMGQIIMQMSNQMQVINITHLPQVAAKGSNHFYVYKNNGTHIKKLNSQERIEKIAMMLSGKNITDQAREQAKLLIEG